MELLGYSEKDATSTDVPAVKDKAEYIQIVPTNIPHTLYRPPQSRTNPLFIVIGKLLGDKFVAIADVFARTDTSSKYSSCHEE